MTELHAQDVSLSIAGALIVEGASLRVDAGEVVGLIGPNGAGKSTLLRLLAGLRAPDRGVVTCEGVPIETLARTRRARLLAFLPQQTESLPSMSVATVVALGRLPHGDADAPTGRRALDRALSDVGMTALWDRSVTRLSGGELARVHLARALAVEAPILLADEPVAALDPAHALAVMRLFARRGKAGLPTVVVLHDLSLAARFCDRIVLMAQGRIVAQGPPAEVLTDAVIRAVYTVTVRRIDQAIVPWDLVSGP